MKKIIVAGAALLMTGGGYVAADNAFAAGDDEAGVKISGDARFRFWFKDKYDFGGWTVPGERTTNKSYGRMKKHSDSRVRVRFTATSAGGAYAVGRIRFTDGGGMNEENHTDDAAGQPGNNWVDEAYIGVPFGDDFTLQVGKYRVTYGTKFSYEDLPMAGARGIIKVGDWEINPFIEWHAESENSGAGYGNDRYWDHDSIRYGVHAGGMVADGWKVGGLLAYQSDSRDYHGLNGHDVNWRDCGLIDEDGRCTHKGHEGWMAMVYVDGKSGPFGLKAEFAYNDGSLKGYNLTGGNDDHHPGDLTGGRDYDDGFGGYIQPSYTIDALTLALNAGFAINGFTPDAHWGFIMLGSSALGLNVAKINNGWDSTWWVGLIASYAISDDLTATGIFAYADMTPYSWNKGSYIDDLERTVRRHGGVSSLEHAFELSAKLDYSVTKNLVFTWAIGTLFASFDDPWQENTNPWGTLMQFNYKF